MSGDEGEGPAAGEALFDDAGELVTLVAALQRRLGRGRLDEEELADLCQDTLLALWEKRSRFRAGSSVGAWVRGFCTLALAKALDRRRSERGVRFGIDLEALPVAGIELEEALVDLREDVGAALGRIDRARSEVLLLKFEHDLSFREMGARLGLPASTVKLRCYQTLQRLGLLLEGRSGIG